MTHDDLVKGDSFVKVDCGVLDSSLYHRSRRDQRSVFFTALFMARPIELTKPMTQLGVRDMQPTGWSVPAGWYGLVRASGSAIIERDGIEQEAGLAALEALGAKDDDSRSRDYEGRRLVRVDGGYIVLNFFTYRDKDYNAAERMRRVRGRRKAGRELFEDAELPVGEVKSSPVANSGERFRNVAQAEAEAETEAKLPTENGTRPLPAIGPKRNVESIRDRLAAVSAEIAEGTRARLKKDQIRTLQAETLFAYWQVKFNKPRACLDDKRERLIVKRLDENKGDVSELFYVLDGALKDDWVTGRAPNARHANDGIEYIFRDRASVEKFASMCRSYRDAKTHPTAAKYAAILTDVAPPDRQLGAGPDRGTE